MARFTDKELREARSHGIDPTKMSRGEYEVKITEARARHARLTKESLLHGKLNDILTMLSMKMIEGETIKEKQRRIEAALLQLLQQKGFVAGARIAFRDDAPSNPGKQGRVTRLAINWISDLPHIPLHLDGMKRTFNYLAHNVVRNATVIAS